jgi:hypothetical protein
VVLAVAPAPLWSEFHARFLKGRLMALTSHHAANFVVQAALAGAQGKPQARAAGLGARLRSEAAWAAGSQGSRQARQAQPRLPNMAVCA